MWRSGVMQMSAGARLCLLGAIGLMGAASCGPAVQAQRGAPVTVGNSMALSVAIRAARPGTTILVQPGRYGVLDLKGRTYSGAPLKILAAGPVRPEFDGADLSGAQGLVLSGLGFSGSQHPVVRMMGTQDVLFAGNMVTGADPDGDPWNNSNAAMHVREVRHVTLYGNRFEDLRSSIYVQRSDRVVLSRNSFRHVREGINIAATTDLSIDGNLFRDFSPRFDKREHPDAIQFWTSREKAGSSDVRIRDNVILVGGCKSVQGIFIRSETERRKDLGPQVRHSNFTIQRNLYYGSARNGLSVSSVDDALVENNVIVGSDYAFSGTKRDSVTDPRCSGALVPGILSRFGTETHRFARNVTNIMGSTDGEARDNVVLSGKGSAKWTDVFAERPAGETPDPSAFLTRPGSKAHRLGIGLLEIRPHGAPATAADALEEGVRLHAAAAGSR